MALKSIRQTVDPAIKLYSLEETAAILGVSERTVNRFIKMPDGLEARRIGGRSWKVSQEAIQDFINRSESSRSAQK